MGLLLELDVVSFVPWILIWAPPVAVAPSMGTDICYTPNSTCTSILEQFI